MIPRLILELETEMEKMDVQATHLWVEDNDFARFQRGEWPNGGFAMVINHPYGRKAGCQCVRDSERRLGWH